MENRAKSLKTDREKCAVARLNEVGGILVPLKMVKISILFGQSGALGHWDMWMVRREFDPYPPQSLCCPRRVG